jgi:hypothetical protein
MNFSVLSLLLLIACTAQAIAVTEDSSNITSLISKAQRALSEQDYISASELLLDVLELSPEHENANSLLGSSYLALERADLAEGDGGKTSLFSHLYIILCCVLNVKFLTAHSLGLVLSPHSLFASLAFA